MQVRCSYCHALISVPMVPQAVGYPSSGYPNGYGSRSISNNAILIAASACLFGLIVVIGVMAILFNVLSKDTPATSAVAVVQEEGESDTVRADFEEGYSMMLPRGFVRQSREETEEGYIVYRFRSDEGFKFTLAILPDEATSMINLPKSLSKALLPGVKELDEGVDGEIQPAYVKANKMPAVVFQYYERETYRGVTFTYFMVAIDRKKKIVMKIAGKYGGFDTLEEDITVPEHWNESLKTFGRDLDAKQRVMATEVSKPSDVLDRASTLGPNPSPPKDNRQSKIGN